MKTLSSTSSSNASPQGSPSDFVQEHAPRFEGLEGLRPPAFPRFPTVEDLLAHERGERLHPLLETAPLPRPQGLFAQMLQGRLDVLVDDVARNPDRYTEEALALIARLAQGRQKVEDLSLEERQVLDRATLDFAKYIPPKPPPAPKKPPKLKLIGADVDGHLGGDALELPGEMASHWWET